MYAASMWTQVQKDIIKSPAIGDKRKVDAPLCSHRDFPYGPRKEPANDH